MTRRDDDLDRALKALTDSRAPRTLLPRVLAAVQVLESRPAWQRRWLALSVWVRVPALGVSATCGALLARAFFTATLAEAGPWLSVARAAAAACGHGMDAAAALWWAWRLPLAAAGAASATACAAGAVLLWSLLAAPRPSAGRGLA